MSTRHLRVLAALTAVLALVLAQPGRAGDVPLDAEISLGQRFRGELSNGADQDLLTFEGLAGQLFSLTLTGGSGSVHPVATLLDEALAVVDTLAAEQGAGTRRFRIKQFELPVTGGYSLLIASADGSSGPYRANTKGKLPKSLRKLTADFEGPPGLLGELSFDAQAGALLSGKLLPVKGSAAVPDLGTLQGPTSPVDIDDFVTLKGSNLDRLLIKKAPLPEFGAYQLEVFNDGEAGALKGRFVLRFPKVAKQTHLEDDPLLGPGGLSGTLGVQPLAVLAEQEPNDGPETAQFVGVMTPGKVVRIVGQTTDGGNPGFGLDNPVTTGFDAFRIRIAQDQLLALSLLHDADTSSVDFDIALFDPSVQPPALVALIGSAAEPELGLLEFSDVTAPFDVDVVVHSFVGSGDYLLTMAAGAVSTEQVTAADAPVAPQPVLAGPAAASGARPQVQLVPAPGQDQAAHAAALAVAAQRVPADGPSDAYAGLLVPFRELELVVILTDPTRDVRQWAAENGFDVRISSPSGWFVATLPDLDGQGDVRSRRAATLAARSRARALPEVADADLNHVYQALGAATPDDPFFNLQWHYAVMNVPAAWAITTGSDQVLVAVIDTGITAHPDLVARDSGTGFDMISSKAVALDGNGIDSNPTDPGDQSGPNGTSSFHGTHVAGTVGASTNNGQGVAGVDQACRLMHLRVLGKGGGSSFDIAEAIRYAARLANASNTLPPQRAHVINMSLGGPVDNQATAAAVAAARGQGVTIIAAAGNENSAQPSFPAANVGVISVAAVDIQKQRAPYSNFGATIDVAATGGDTTKDLNGDGFADGVLSTLVNQQQGGFSFVFFQGTSMASPHVAGIAALMLSLDPTLTPDQLEAALKASAEDLGAPGRDDLFGEGLVDALAAVQAVQVGGGNPDPALSLGATLLAFGTSQTTLGVQVANVGGGTLDFQATDTEFTGGDWMSLAGTPGSAPATLVVSVDRTGLAPGAYSGRIDVTSNGGDLSIDVTLEVAGAAGDVLDLGPLFVLAVDLDSFETVGQAETTEALGDWSMEDVPAGLVLLVAGPDLDGDGFICGPGEPCGLFPVANDPVLVQVVGTQVKSGLDFAITDGLGLASAPAGPDFSLPPGGFALRAP